MILAFWSVYVIINMIYYNSMVNMMATSGALMGIIIYLLTNPAYLLLIYFIIKNAKHSKFKATLASIMTIFALDMVASPRVLVEEIFTNGSATIMNLGTIIIKSLMALGLNVHFAWYLYYLVFPILLFIMAMELMGVVDFVKKIGNGGV